jgi:hypothetical protein
MQKYGKYAMSILAVTCLLSLTPLTIAQKTFTSKKKPSVLGALTKTESVAFARLAAGGFNEFVKM